MKLKANHTTKKPRPSSSVILVQSSWPTLNGTGREWQNFTIARLQYSNKDQMGTSIYTEHTSIHKNTANTSRLEVPGGTRNQLSQWRTRFLNDYIVNVFTHLLSYKYLWDVASIPELN